MNHRTVFFVSDGTAITSETLGASLLTQFGPLPYLSVRLPYTDTPEKAKEVRDRINKAHLVDQHRPIVFATLMEPNIRHTVARSQALFLDLVSSFLNPLEQELGVASSHAVGLSHSMGNPERYLDRIEAVNFTLQCDDGVLTKHYDNADVILVGVSRSGKTPTCLYLALHFCLRAANYPLTEEDLGNNALPECLRHLQPRLVGLTIDPEHLVRIREQRRPHSRYASLDICRQEIAHAEALFKRHNIPVFPSTHASVEELATRIMAQQKLQAHFKNP